MGSRRRRRERQQVRTIAPLRRSDAVLLFSAGDRLVELAESVTVRDQVPLHRLARDLRVRAYELDKEAARGTVDDIWVRGIKELFDIAGIEGTHARSAYVGNVIGHRVAKLSDLTIGEGCALVRSLEARAAREGL